MAKILTAIRDKNGKHTHVWKNSLPILNRVKATKAPTSYGVSGAFAFALSAVEDDEYMERVITPILHDLYEKYGEPECGRTRAVFDMGDGNVIKVPLDFEGVNANTNEFHVFDMDDPFIPVARCHFIQDYGHPLLVMEKIDIESLIGVGYKDLPDWVGYVDCKQVGYNSIGELVAYDL